MQKALNESPDLMQSGSVVFEMAKIVKGLSAPETALFLAVLLRLADGTVSSDAFIAAIKLHAEGRLSLLSAFLFLVGTVPQERV